MAAVVDDVARRPRADPATPRRPIGLHLRGITKRFGTRRVLHDLDLMVSPGSFVAVVGRSGCGKSTLLRIAAGLERADAGHVEIHDATGRTVPARSDVRVLFQEARLLPWKRVVDNVRLGLAPDRARTDLQRATEALVQVGLADRAEDWPAVLSGGQRQRVALARALVHRPGFLLLDEPLGALDALTRIEMQQLIERLREEHPFGALLVTHDIEEAVLLSDRVVLIENGAVALDVPVTLPRPRPRGDPAVGGIVDRILGRVLA